MSIKKIQNEDRNTDPKKMKSSPTNNLNNKKKRSTKKDKKLSEIDKDRQKC